jgi:putative phosphoribosyl transferase
MSSPPPPREARLAPPIYRDRAEAGLLLGEKVREVLASCDDPERSRGFGIPAQPGAHGEQGSSGEEHGPGDQGRPGEQGSPGEQGGKVLAPLAIRVLAIPRGGVAVAAGVAHCLGAVFPDTVLDVVVVRKVGHPEAPELGLGAIAEGAGGPVFDDELLTQVGLTRADLGGVVARERAELDRRMAVYHRAVGQGPGDYGSGDYGAGDYGVAESSRPCDVAVVVDDGLATGVTARAALRAVRARGVPRIMLAVPVAAQQAVAAMEEELAKAGTGEVVTLVTSRRFRSVGEWYADFGQLTDTDVLTLLSSGGTTPRTPRMSR